MLVANANVTASLLQLLKLNVILLAADEQEGDGHRFVREIRTNMKPPAVKATGKVTVC